MTPEEFYVEYEKGRVWRHTLGRNFIYQDLINFARAYYEKTVSEYWLDPEHEKKVTEFEEKCSIDSGIPSDFEIMSLQERVNYVVFLLNDIYKKQIEDRDKSYLAVEELYYKKMMEWQNNGNNLSDRSNYLFIKDELQKVKNMTIFQFIKWRKV